MARSITACSVRERQNGTEFDNPIAESTIATYEGLTTALLTFLHCRLH